jgi:hypothetical protein
VAANDTIAAQHSWQPIDLVALGADEPDPPTIGGILYPGKRHLLYAEAETLKSWLALCLTAEQLELGQAVLWLDYEMDGRQVLGRLHDLGVSADAIRDQFIYLHPSEPLGELGTVTAFETLVAHRNPSLAVVDAMTAALTLQNLDPNIGRDIELFYRGIADRCRAHGAAVLVLDHVTKDRETRGRFAIGSERKVSAVDVALGLKIERAFGRGRSGLAHITVNKDRGGYLTRPRAADFEITSDPDTGRVTWSLSPPSPSTQASTDTGFKPTALMEKVDTYLSCQLGPVSRNQIALAVTGRKEYVLMAIDCLMQDGRAQLAEDGKRIITSGSRNVPAGSQPVPGTGSPVPHPYKGNHGNHPGAPEQTTPLELDGIPA